MLLTAPEGLGEGVPSMVPLPMHPHMLPAQGEKPSWQLPFRLGAGAHWLPFAWAMLTMMARSQQDFPVPAPALEQGQHQQLGARHLLKGAWQGQNNNKKI